MKYVSASSPQRLRQSELSGAKSWSVTAPAGGRDEPFVGSDGDGFVTADMPG